jgi:hypothetical protein
MTERDRREHPRTPVKLAITALTAGADSLSQAAGELWTDNISVGGMYFRLPRSQAPDDRVHLAFELFIPPGSGYSAVGGTVRGLARVIRIDPAGEDSAGVAVSFTEPLALTF